MPASTPKNKSISMPVLIVIFVLGIALFCYPFVSSFLYEQSALQVKTDYEESSNKYSQEQLNKMRAAVREYNDALINAGVILMEPFDPDTYDVDAMYVKLPTDDPVMGYVNIPSLNVTLPIYHTTEARALELGAGHLAHTSLPIGGANTHSVISAHSGLPNAEMFTHLDRLQNGNIFTIDILGETLTYEVYDIETVLPDEVDSLTIKENQDLATLVTCTPVGINTHRLLVHGKRTYSAGDVEEPALGFSISYTDVVSVLALLIAIAFIIILIRQKRQQKKPVGNVATNQGFSRPINQRTVYPHSTSSYSDDSRFIRDIQERYRR